MGQKIFKLLTAVLICQGAGIIGAVFTTSNISTWYFTLNKPVFTPPNWLFGPAWTFLYFLMGISLYLIWQEKDSKQKKLGLKLFFAQLGLNTLWSIIFFGGHSLVGGLVIIILLWVLILLTINAFHKIKKAASYLLYPYLAWVSFATILNLSIVLLNL